MINGVKAKSESKLNGIEADVLSLDGYDPNFVRELQEAERLLDDEEKRLHAVEKATQKVVPTAVKVQEQPDTDTKSSDDKDSLEVSNSQSHPDFPGVKSTGRGEMGDLEFFHLPIIFKSHVTGFEPTKDLLLEPGNVIAGQYMVESELGTAAFSTAYRCIDFSSEGPDVSTILYMG